MKLYDTLLGKREYSEIIEGYIKFISTYLKVNENTLDKIKSILLQKEDTQDPLYNQPAFVAAYLGVHGLSHLIMKYL